MQRSRTRSDRWEARAPASSECSVAVVTDFACSLAVLHKKSAATVVVDVAAAVAMVVAACASDAVTAVQTCRPVAELRDYLVERKCLRIAAAVAAGAVVAPSEATSSAK